MYTLHLLLIHLIDLYSIFNDRFNIFKGENIQRSLFPKTSADRNVDYDNFIDLNMGSSFSFSRFCDLSPQDMEYTNLKGTFYALLRQKRMNVTLKWLEYATTWQQSIPLRYLFLSASVSLAIISLIESNPRLFFTRWVCNLSTASLKRNI